MSYSEKLSDYTVDDTTAAADANAFLRLWFGTKFPALQKNSFFISG